MKTPILTFFNNKGGVGKTSLIYHLAWMFSHLNKKTLIADIDPQANLTAAFLDDEIINDLWNIKTTANTIYQCVKPLIGIGDISEPEIYQISENLFLLPGDVALSGFEDQLSNEWPKSLDTKNLYRPLRILSSFWQLLQKASDKTQADIILVDIGPNLGAINRSVLIAADFVVIPMAADLFSLQGLKNLGPTLQDWKKAWEKRLNNWLDSDDKKESPDLQLPEGKMQAIGYLCQQYSTRLSRPVRSYDRWVQKIPAVFRESVLNEKTFTDIKQEDDPYCLAIIKHFRSLVPMAQEHRKPIFDLTVADGAIGSHAGAVTTAKEDFAKLAKIIADKTGITLN